VTTGALRLYGYWRSSAVYRVRIALNLKKLDYENFPVHLVRDGGEQHAAPYRDLNPQELVPVLLHGSRILRQSMAIIEYLDETFCTGGRLMLPTARDRERGRPISRMIASEMHPLNNLRVQQYLENTLGVSEAKREEWTRHWIRTGFEALEHILGDNPSTGDYCDGEGPTMADCCLVPQVYVANRFGVDLAPYPTIRRINATCLALEAFEAARPENQPDAPAAG